jgi:NADH-quinone oxidoreductase subunit M
MLLSWLTFLPLVFAAAIWALPKDSWVRPVALIFAIIEFGLSLVMFGRMNPASAGLQMVEQKPWIESFGITYFLGVDGISLWLVLLSTFLIPLVVLGSWNAIDTKIRQFHSLLFVLLTTMVGTFLALDAVLFYTFFEASLFPMYFMIGIWGGTRRLYATMKFVLYTMAGSLLMLVAIIALMVMTEQQFGQMSASLLDFYKLQIPYVSSSFANPQLLMFFAFSLAFAIKVPSFPVHTWLPDAHVEAPTPGSVILAAVMLKMGTYGFLRMVVPMFPEAVSQWGWLFLLLGVIGIVYGALVAMVQPDMKKLVAYSSVSHMGYVMLGCFSLNAYGFYGGLFQMLNHGVSTGALFFLVGMIYERTHSREIKKYGGLALAMPVFTIYFFIVTLSSIAVPMTNGFVGEFLILLGTFQTSKLFGTIAALGVVLGAAYMLWMFKNVFFGEPGELVRGSVPESKDAHGHHAEEDDHQHAIPSHVHHKHDEHNDDHGKLVDLSWREHAVLMPLVVLIFWMGLFPQTFLSYSKASLDHLATSLHNYELSVDGAAGLAPVEQEKVSQ